MSGILNSIRDWYEKLEARERKLVSWFGVALGAFILFVIPLGISAMLGSRRADNREIRDAIFALRNGRDAYAARQAKQRAVAARYAKKAPALAGLLENAARENHLEIPESQDRPEIAHGKKYTERSTVVRLRKTSMLQLVKMLESIEKMHMPLAITKLNVRRRAGEKDSYDVELGVSAFDRTEPAGNESKPAAEHITPASTSRGGKP